MLQTLQLTGKVINDALQVNLDILKYSPPDPLANLLFHYSDSTDSYLVRVFIAVHTFLTLEWVFMQALETCLKVQTAYNKITKV